MSNEYKDWSSDTMVENALAMASLYHRDQKRKYTNEPYIEHPKLVSKIITDYMISCDDIPLFTFDPMDYAVIKSAALLHDTIEDTNATYEEIQKVFGKSVCDLVYWLTDDLTPADGNRKFRKQKYLEKIVDSPYDAKCLKIADILANIRNLAKVVPTNDMDFAFKYVGEKEDLVKELKSLKERKKNDKRYYWYKIFSRMLNDLEIELKETRNQLERRKDEN